MGVRAVVVGAGWAGEGYVHALRGVGVDVVALCGRTPEPAYAMGRKLGIADVRLDWRVAIEDLRPDVVVVATPAGPHRDIVGSAAGLGCHLLCEKPLGRNADEARAMLEMVDRSGVKHAYGATSRYSPALAQARALLDEGLIGELQEVEAVGHYGMPRLMSYAWVHSLEQGGGMLMNVLPHFLGQAQYVSGGAPRWVYGLADSLIDRAPVGSPVHDFRKWSPVDAAAADDLDWRDVDADLRATVIVGLERPDGELIRALWHVSPFASGRNADYLALAGSKGTIHLTGFPWHRKLEHKRNGTDEWIDVPISPADVTTDPVQQGWNLLTAEFIRDVRGLGDTNYPTFRDGYLANEIMDRVRSSTAQPLAGFRASAP
jgi:predicted dehydrogenase